jgi:hypothetical protein
MKLESSFAPRPKESCDDPSTESFGHIPARCDLGDAGQQWRQTGMVSVSGISVLNSPSYRGV